MSEKIVYIVSVVLESGHTIELYSATEPRPHLAEDGATLASLDWTPLPGAATVGYLAWSTAVLVSWECESTVDAGAPN